MRSRRRKNKSKKEERERAQKRKIYRKGKQSYEKREKKPLIKL